MHQSLAQSLQLLKENIKSISDDHLINLFDYNKCQKIDDDCKDPLQKHLRSKREKCLLNLNKCQVDHTDELSEAFSAYNEILVYEMLKNRTQIEPVKEIQTHTPDFILTTKNRYNVNVELKTLQFNDGIYNYRDIQKQHTRVKIELEKARKSEQFDQDLMRIVTSPFKNADQPVTRNWAIESLINKTQNAYDFRQLTYNNNSGILLIDTVVFQFPYFIQEALPYYLYAPLNTLVSGCLWHCCYGKSGERVFEPIIYPGEKNIGMPLAKDGVLIGDGSLQAVAFIVHTGSKPVVIGFMKSEALPVSLEHAMGEICDYINDEYNMSLLRPIPISPLQMAT